MIEIICAILGLIQGVLVMLNKRSNWIVYALQMLFLVIFSWQANLYGDFAQNVFYFFFCIYAWWIWQEGGIADRIKVLTNKYRIFACLLVIGLTFFIGLALTSTNDPMPYTDAFTTVTTFVALFLTSIRRIEAWVVWFFNDIAYMYQYFYLPNQALYLFGLYCVWTILAVATFINWVKIYKKELIYD